MRENYTWTTDCGPVIGEIKHGKRYINGNVSEEQYEKDMAAVENRFENLDGKITTALREESEMRSDIRNLQTTTDKVDSYFTLVKGDE